MRHRKSVKLLSRSHAHRKAMFSNMVTSLFMKERIVTTKEKAKVLKRLTDKLITRAKRNLDSAADQAKVLHNKRTVMKTIHNRGIITKLFNDIAPRYKTRNGGYTRIYLLGKKRAGDASDMAIIELVDRKVVATHVEKPVKADKEKKSDKESKKADAKKEVKDKKEKKEKKEK
jgi:large subunit ribosomal protein L17